MITVSFATALPTDAKNEFVSTVAVFIAESEVSVVARRSSGWNGTDISTFLVAECRWDVCNKSGIASLGDVENFASSVSLCGDRLDVTEDEDNKS